MIAAPSRRRPPPHRPARPPPRRSPAPLRPRPRRSRCRRLACLAPPRRAGAAAALATPPLRSGWRCRAPPGAAVAAAPDLRATSPAARPGAEPLPPPLKKSSSCCAEAGRRGVSAPLSSGTSPPSERLDARQSTAPRGGQVQRQWWTGVWATVGLAAAVLLLSSPSASPADRPPAPLFVLAGRRRFSRAAPPCPLAAACAPSGCVLGSALFTQRPSSSPTPSVSFTASAIFLDTPPIFVLPWPCRCYSALSNLLPSIDVSTQRIEPMRTRQVPSASAHQELQQIAALGRCSGCHAHQGELHEYCWSKDNQRKKCQHNGFKPMHRDMSK